MSPNHSADHSMRTMNNQKRHEGGRTLPKLPQNRVSTFFYGRRIGTPPCAVRTPQRGVPTGGGRCVFALLFVCGIPIYAAGAPFHLASVFGPGAGNIGSAAKSGRVAGEGG